MYSSEDLSPLVLLQESEEGLLQRYRNELWKQKPAGKVTGFCNDAHSYSPKRGKT